MKETQPHCRKGDCRTQNNNRFRVLLVAALALFIILPPWLSSPWPEAISMRQFVDVITGGSAPVAQGVMKPVELPSPEGRVEWDNYSLIINGQRIFLHSGEFHTFRLPVPSLWPDILQKMKAAGLNGISVYTHMGLINPSPRVVDFGGFRALQPLFDAARQTGLWIVIRPGPYINAETSAGGISHWITSEVAGKLRTNATDFHKAWQDYIHGIIEVIAPNQVTVGGPVIAVQIDNEYTQIPGTSEYFAELEDAFRSSGIIVPLTYNDPGAKKNFVNGTGAVDIYGMDFYPQEFDCSSPTKWKGITANYHTYHQNTNPAQPFYIPEFQGGSYDAWGPGAPGYTPCRVLTGPDFQSVFNLQLWASNAKLINYYMLYGGTNWGAIPFHGVYTSYDYGSAIAENRTLTTKFTELKRQGIFLRSSPDFYKTYWVANSSTGVTTTNSAAFVTLLRNPDTDASFYIARQTDSTSTASTSFKLNVTTTAGALQVPQIVPSITLNGRQSKLIITNYAFGSSRLQYSTASVFFAGKIDDRDVIYLYGDSNQAHETALVLRGKPRIQAHSSSVSFTRSGASTMIISFLPGIEGLVTIWDSDQQLVLFGDTVTAGTFWAPAISGSSSDSFKEFWQFGTNSSVLVGGPYLVRSAAILGSRLALRGDLDAGVRLTVIAPSNIRSITWNDELVASDAEAALALTSRGGFVGHLKATGAAFGITVPVLQDWRYANSLPEIEANFSDADWVAANHTTTNIPYPLYYGDGRILYGCDYGFCENIVLWRGHFNATGDEKFVNLSVNGGQAFAASVWLNDVFLNTTFGNSSNNLHVLEETDDQFSFPTGSLLPGQDNVITIVQDNMGNNETDGENTNASKSPRGIRGFKLDSGTFSEWKVQGKVGGYTNYPDKVRGVFNEGGLFGERKGWHLPGFDTSVPPWINRSLSSGLPNSAAGVGFFVTTFELGIPRGFDVALSFTFEEETMQPYRAYLFVNGWMMGKRVANLGPQFKFPVHEGILEYNGQNTVAVALWAMERNTAVSPRLQLTIDKIVDGGVGGVTTNNPLWLKAERE